MLVAMVTVTIICVGGMMYAVGNTYGYEKCEKDAIVRQNFMKEMEKNGWL